MQQVGNTSISRTWLLLNSDPEPAEFASIGSKIAVGVSILIRTALGPDPQAPPVPGGVIAVLRDYAAVVGAFLLLLAVVHLVGVFHNRLRTRRTCALISSGWWVFSVYLVAVLIGPQDARVGTFLVLFLVSLWTSWRLWRPGVRDLATPAGGVIDG